MSRTGVRFPPPTVSSSNQRWPRVARQPLVQSGGEYLRAFSLDPRGRRRIRRGGEPSWKEGSLRRKGGEGEESSSCLLASRLVRSRAGWRPWRRTWSLALGAALLAAGSCPTTGQARPDHTRREGTPARLYRIKTQRGPVLFGVCVCVCVVPSCKSKLSKCPVFIVHYISLFG